MQSDRVCLQTLLRASEAQMAKYLYSRQVQDQVVRVVSCLPGNGDGRLSGPLKPFWHRRVDGPLSGCMGALALNRLARCFGFLASVFGSLTRP